MMPDLFDYLSSVLPPELQTADVLMWVGAARQHLQQHPCTLVMPEATQVRLTIGGQDCRLPYRTGGPDRLPPARPLELFPEGRRPQYPPLPNQTEIPME